MMHEGGNLPANLLPAKQLLHNKGIRSTAWTELERSLSVLPKVGMKQFEPNGSLLQSMQIEKGIKHRKQLLEIERVERNSQLAIADWLPAQKKACVTKRSGQDWSNFGIDKSGTLYLIPEEALFLLETNCLELFWNEVPLSIQQAYDLLIDNIECSLEEYRVYSQLVRYGYRVQRFIYDQAQKSTSIEEQTPTKRKVIIHPENGLRMADSQLHLQHTSENIKTSEKSSQQLDKNPDDLDVQICPVTSAPEELMNDVQKIIKEPMQNSTKENVTPTKWHAQRIQRNVKLLPKRTDKPASADAPIMDTTSGGSEHNAEKRKSSVSSLNNVQIKKSKHEVIELSDDEIQEVPRPMTRMEMLNLIPNMGATPMVATKISRGYIPHSIKPHKNIYHYNRANMHVLQAADKKARLEVKQSNNNVKETHSQNNIASGHDHTRSTDVVPFNNQNSGTNMLNFSMRGFYSTERANFSSSYIYNNRFPFQYNHNAYWQNRNTVNMFFGIENYNNMIHQNRYFTIHTNNYVLPMMLSNMMRTPLVRHHIQQSFHQTLLPQRRLFQQRTVQNMSIHCDDRNISYAESRRCHSRESYRDRNMSQGDRDVYQASFKALPGNSSWSELKKRWHEVRTITIDDEDPTNKKIDCNEVQVVQQIINPLVGPKNAGSLAEVFEKLRIIKSAPEKIVRRKRCKYKISYNVYSNTQHYRKAYPGLPMYRLVVIRQKDDPFLQPIDLNRLQQDAKDAPILLACVSMSISYIQPGVVALPNLT
ncbi:hypothetical protein KM043_009456 [Ampulex compressa]|nr:hypothetical protein KM043_009456 [Ampulex compressa]